MNIHIYIYNIYLSFKIIISIIHTKINSFINSFFIHFLLYLYIYKRDAFLVALLLVILIKVSAVKTLMLIFLTIGNINRL